MKSILTIVCMVCFLISCENQIDDLRQLKKEKDVQLLYLDAMEADEIIEGEQYIQNRKVLKEIELSDKQKKSLIQALINTENYEPVNRKCKFEPVYAINVKDSTVAVFDVEYCPALIYYKEDGTSEYLQLITDSSLKTELEELTK